MVIIGGNFPLLGRTAVQAGIFQNTRMDAGSALKDLCFIPKRMGQRRNHHFLPEAAVLAGAHSCTPGRAGGSRQRHTLVKGMGRCGNGAVVTFLTHGANIGMHAGGHTACLLCHRQLIGMLAGDGVSKKTHSHHTAGQKRSHHNPDHGLSVSQNAPDPFFDADFAKGHRAGKDQSSSAAAS